MKAIWRLLRELLQEPPPPPRPTGHRPDPHRPHHHRRGEEGGREAEDPIADAADPGPAPSNGPHDPHHH